MVRFFLVSLLFFITILERVNKLIGRSTNEFQVLQILWVVERLVYLEVKIRLLVMSTGRLPVMNRWRRYEKKGLRFSRVRWSRVESLEDRWMLSGMPGDFNGNYIVDAADFAVWRDELGSDTALTNDGGLGVPIGNAHYELWKTNFGYVLDVLPNASPTVSITSPADLSSFTFAGEILLSGFADDSEDGSLSGESMVWTSSLDGELGTGESVLLPGGRLIPGEHVITLTATDAGQLAGSDQVTILVEENQPPQVLITSPTDGSVFVLSDDIVLEGTGDDREDGPLIGESLVWSSNLAGQLGTGESVVLAAGTLSPGTHIITLTATDSGSLTETDSVIIDTSTCLSDVPCETASPCGVGICVVEQKIVEGQRFDVHFLPPPGRSFGWNFSLYRDSVSQENFLTNPSLSAAQDAVPAGSPFVITLDSLNWQPGTYVVRALTYTDSIVVLPRPATTAERVRNDMITGGRTLGLYSEDGELVADGTGTEPMPVMEMGTVYAVAVDLNRFLNLRNRIDLQFIAADGVEVLSENLLQISLVTDRSMGAMMRVHGACPAQLLDAASHPAGVALSFFRSPEHQPYYENDAPVRLRLRGNVLGGPSLCAEQDIVVNVLLDDDPALPPIPSFEEYNAENFPDEPSRNDLPLDTRHVRIVRFGGVGMTGFDELEAAARDIEGYFSVATKGYFELVVDGVEIIPYDAPATVQKVTDWYESAPKTPGKPLLDLEEPDEQYLATLLYYYEHEEEFVDDFLALYPSRSQGEDLTIYWVDGPGSLGVGMGNIGATRIKISRLYPGSLFYDGTGEDRTYHYDLDSCSLCGDTTAEYIDYLAEVGGLDTFRNTTLHEFGHVFWSQRSGFSVGDIQTRRLPFNSAYTVLDRSQGFFTRFEYMSYGRDRTVLDGMSYGDVFLDSLLLSYAEPVGVVECLSHPGDAETVAVVEPGEEIVVRLGGITGSGLLEISYGVLSGPVELSGAAASGSFGYDAVPRPTRAANEEVSFTLQTPGEYSYELVVRDQLYGEIEGHEHEYRKVFTIRVSAVAAE